MAIEVVLPTLHPGQTAAFRLRQPDGSPARFRSIRCGRRWGKTQLLETIACDGATKGQNIGVFAPDYKITAETYTEIAEILAPIKASASKIEGVIRTTTGGRIDFWTLDNERAGRSRKYHKVLIDEAAFGKPNLMRVWETAIKPSLLDYRGSAWAFSTPNGIDEENFFWRIGNQPEHGFAEFHAPSFTNPYLPADELEKLEAENHPLVFQQEYLAQWVSWAGVAFFAADKLLVDGKPVALPRICDKVFAVIDSAVKGGREHDGTFVSYWARSAHLGHPLVCLDWDVVQIDGAMLEHWIPGVFRRCEELARECRARMGSIGAFIEDAQSGSILLQQCANRGLPAQALPSTLTAAGKDNRAINASGPVYQGKVKFSGPAYEKVATFKGATRNHLWSQIISYRVGDKAAATRADDGLDTFTYAVAITLGNQEGVA
jgi:hypothetical protein